MVLGALEKILDIELAPDIDIRNVSLIKIDGGDKLQKEGKSLKVNVSELDPNEREEFLELAPEQFEVQSRVLNEDEEEDAEAIEQGFDETKEEILDYFEGILSEEYLSVVEMGLHLRALIEHDDLTKEDIRERKADIAKQYGGYAIYLTSLTTAGYFGRDGGIRDIYVEMELNDQYDRYNFQQRLKNMVEKKLLCVFVENDDTAYEVYQEVRGRLARYQREEPVNDWFDIRGTGEQCEDIIDGAVEFLEDEFIGIDYDRWTEGEVLCVRIHPHSVQDISVED